MTGNLQGILGLVITSSVLIAIPGPSILFLVGQALSAGKKNALKGVAGNTIGMYSIAVLLAFGIGAVLMSSPQILMIIRLIGAFVLLLIGWQYVRASRISMAMDVPADKGHQSFFAGIIVGAANPKSVIMFGTIVPGFTGEIPPEMSATTVLLLMSLIPIALGIVIDIIWVYAAHAVKSASFFWGNSLRWFNLCGGILMILMALLLAVASVI